MSLPSAGTLVFWVALVFVGLTIAMTAVPGKAPVTSLRDGLGPRVDTQSL